VTDAALVGWRRLSAAVLLRAYFDAKDGNGHSAEARAFLESEGAGGLLAELGIDPARLGAVVEGLPEPAQPMLPGLEV
jgi:hypothetical protein